MSSISSIMETEEIENNMEAFEEEESEEGDSD
jgi:hypothetical protein